ncbi:peptidoglycan-binding protein [Rhizobium puerariae]|uniref:Peptidoglycan-binding protein n=1 Tax=Rhizobium puerariae TaxID=1585791 RepID=A0ABV6AL26_9HYPH
MLDRVSNSAANSDFPVAAAVLDIRYPEKVIKRGEFNSLPVRRIQERLNETLKANLIEDGDFGEATENAVRLFQARHAGIGGEELEVDGEVGQTTWAALFGAESIYNYGGLPARGDLRSLVITIAASQIGVTERPIGSNRGPQVDEYIRAAGLDPAQGNYPWCVCFLQWDFRKAAQTLGTPLTIPRTAGVHALWELGQRTANDVVRAGAAKPSAIRPGMIFLMDTGGGKGHAGLVEAVEGDRLVTIEGNTNDGGSREGYGVFRRRTRKVAMPGLLGYLDFCS